MSVSKYDAVVIGAGHNGLVTAAYLAKAGLRVMVLERRTVLGGAAATEEIFPGYRVNTGSAEAGLFLPEIAADLGLEKRGLEWLESPAVVTALQPGGDALTLWRDVGRTQGEIARRSPADAEKYPAYLERVRRLSGVLETMRRATPPDLKEYRVRDLLPWLRVALQLKGLGKREMMEFIRVLPLPVTDFLDEWFQDPDLKAALGVSGVSGSMQGPQASGTAFMLLYQAAGAGGAGFRASRFVKGGTGRLSEILAEAAREFKAEVCPGLGASQILLENGRAVGVRLDNGEQVSARLVVSSADPRRTFFDLLGAPNLPVRFVREVKNIKFRGSTARVNLALSGLPQFAGADNPEQSGGHILICPSLEYLERAYDEAKYGEFSRHPCLDMTLPTLLDPSLAPPGRHILSVDLRYAPYRLGGLRRPREADWDAQREQLGDRVVEILAGYAPGIGELILHRQVLTPLDLERQYGLAEGSIYHGQMGLDQLLFMRPAGGFGRYRTPVENLYLCGSGAHPGGGVTGAPGYNAAREILKDLR